MTSTVSQILLQQSASNLTITFELERVAVEPGSTVGSSLDAIGSVSTLAQSTRLASSRSKSTALTVLVHGVDNPIDARIIANLGMRGIDQNDFIILHGSILINPVRVENTEIGILASNLFFGNGLKVAFKLQVVDTLMLGLTPNHTSVVLTLASTTTDSTSDNNVSLLGLVPQTVSLFGTSRLVDAGNAVALTVFPSADAKQKAEGVTLLVTPQLFHVLVSRHDVGVLLRRRKEEGRDE